MSKTIIVDFDNYICNTVKGANREPVITDKPLVPVIKLLQKLYEEHDEIVIHTSRPEKDKYDIAVYLQWYKVPFSKIVCGKPKGDFYLGDNYFNFDIFQILDKNVKQLLDYKE